MTWRMWGDIFLTADISNIDSTCEVKFLKNRLVDGVRVWLIKYGDPAYTSMSMDIYSQRNDTTPEPGKLLFSSTNSKTKAEIDLEITEDYGAISTYFTFDDFRARQDESYYFHLNIAGYTGTDASHWAWRKQWPDHIYKNNIETDFEDLVISPRSIGIISSDF